LIVGKVTSYTMKDLSKDNFFFGVIGPMSFGVQF